MSSVAVLILLAAACSGGGGSGGGSGTPTAPAGAAACRLSGAQVTDIVGFAVEDGVGTSGQQDCFYSSPDETRSVVVVVRHIPGGEAKVVANLRKDFKDVTAMSGNPHAYSIPHLSEVVLFAGQRQIIVICRHLDPAKELALAEAVAG